MSKISTIAINTFMETIRDRILYVIVLFAAILCLMAIILGSLSVGNNVKIILDLGLGTINIFGVILAIFIGTSIVFKEIDRKTIYMILSKPIDRWEFILGKFLGLSLTILIVTIIMSTVFIILLLIYHIKSQQLYLTFVSLFMILIELFIMTAVCVMFSSFSTPLLSMVFALSIWVIGHFNPTMLMLAQYANNDMVLGLVTFLHYIFPDFSKFNIKNNIDNLDYVLNLAQVGYTTLYGVLYCAAILSISMFAFSRREFN